MKIYVKSGMYFYVRDERDGMQMVPKGANLMEYAGQTLFVSDQVRMVYCYRDVTESNLIFAAE